jgi:NAD(P)-dependent dehydrogenase (short-subunit alcohol dehydrogenase family)
VTALRYDGRVAVVTGGGRGLGRAYALLLAARGAKVVVNDLGGALDGAGADTGPAQEVVGEITAAGGEAVASTDSVATPDGGRAIVETAVEAFGSVDILVHNAGIVRRSPLAEMRYEDFDDVLDVHLRGAFHVVRPAFPLMCDAGYGRIVLTSSIGGLYGNHGVAHYAAAKAGVRSNVIVPAAVTRMAQGIDTSAYPPMGADLVAPVVGYLAHESCSLTGEMVVALAGRVATASLVETAGAYRPSWTVEDVADDLDTVRDRAQPVSVPVVPSGHDDHIRYSFGRAAQGAVHA